MSETSRPPFDKQDEQLHGAEEDTPPERLFVSKEKGEADKKPWMQASNATREASKRAAQDMSHQTEMIDTVMQVHEADLKAHDEAISNPRNIGWNRDMLKAILALEDNGV